MLAQIEQRQTTPAEAAVYRLSLEGWRHYRRKDLAAAEKLLDQAARAAPANGTIRYRHAHVMAARGDAEGARAEYEAVLTMPRRTNPAHFAAACAELAAILERTDRARALELYTRAANVFGADARLKARAARNAERLRG